MSGGRDNGMTPFRAGVLALVVLALFAYFGFSKSNPFANPYEFKAVFNDVNNLKPKSPVRIAGVEVGKVLKVEPVESGKGAAEVTMEVQDKGLPIKKDAERQDPPAHLPRGQLLRGRRARLAVRGRPARTAA